MRFFIRVARAAGAAAAALALSLFPRLADAGTMTYGSPSVQSLYSGAGTSGDKFDIVILAEGYTSSQMSLFSTNATTLRDAIVGFAPYNTYAKFIRVWQVNTISTDSGVDKPVWGTYRNTCFDGAYNMAVGDTAGPGRLLTVSNTANINAAKGLVSGADLVIVIVNDTYYGGAGGGGLCTTYNGSSMTGVVTHETGHAATNLADEYCYSNLTWSGGEPSQPNITTMSYAPWARWSAWVGTTVADGGSVSTFQGGAGSYQYGIYRPVNNACHMKSLGYGFCPVCREAVIRMMYSKTAPITWSSSSAYWEWSWSSWWFGSWEFVNYGTFSACFDEIVPDGSTYVVWNVDGSWVGSSYSYLAGSATRWVLNQSLAPGDHTVTGWVVDTSSMLAIGGWYARPMYNVSWSFTQR